MKRTFVNDAEREKHQKQEIQKKLIALGLVHKPLVPKIAEAIGEDEIFGVITNAMKVAASEGYELSRQNFQAILNDSIEQREMTPERASALRSNFDCISILTATKLKEADFPGLIKELTRYEKHDKVRDAGDKLAKGDYENGIKELREAGDDERADALQSALVRGGKLPLKGNIIKMSSVVEKPLRWLWAQRIPEGKLTLFYGNGELGKSMITADITARVSRGMPWPDGSPCEQGRVLIISGEDDLSDTLAPRLRAAGYDTDAVDTMQTVNAMKDGKLIEKGFTLHDLPQLEASISDGKYKLVIIDPLAAYLDGTDSHKDSDIRQILTPLKEVAERHRTTMLLVSHMNKGKGMRAAHRVMGSVGIVNACRAAYLFVEDGKDAERRLMLPTKLNLARKQGGLAYRVISSDAVDDDGNRLPKIEWLGDANVTADEALAASEDMSQGERDGAKAFLRQTLENGPKSAMVIMDDAASRGISERTLKRAKDELCVYSEKKGSGRWVWMLPPTVPTVPTVPTAEDETAF